MSDDVLIDIINLCLSIDKKAFEIYRNFSTISENDELKAFWKKMSLEEMGHIRYCKKLLDLAEKGMIPQVFDEPFIVREELEAIQPKIDELQKRSEDHPGIANNFLLAYRMEFYMLHMVFGTLFHFLKTVQDKKTPEDDYEDHINKFIDALNKYGLMTPELELLGETIKKLWYGNKKLALQSSSDSLMNILNRRGLFTTITLLAHLSMRNNYNIGIMMIDIDHFKKINDTYGHQKGDDILRLISSTIKKSIRSSDVVGRYGGEEILVFLSPVAPKALLSIAEKVRHSVEECTKYDIPVTISVGVSRGIIESDVERELNMLIKKADENLYRAKDAGRNKVIISNS